MDSDEEQHLSKLLHACDEVLDYHEAADRRSDMKSLLAVTCAVTALCAVPTSFGQGAIVDTKKDGRHLRCDFPRCVRVPGVGA